MQQAEPVTYAIQQIATQYQLGSLRAIYEARKETWQHRLPGVLALLVGGAVLAYFFHAYDSLFRFWPTWQIALVPLIGLGWIAVGLWILLAPWFSPEERIFVYTEGKSPEETRDEILSRISYHGRTA